MSWLDEDEMRIELKCAIADAAMAMHSNEIAETELTKAAILKDACRKLEAFERECQERYEQWKRTHPFEPGDAGWAPREPEECYHCGRAENEHGEVTSGQG